MMNFYTFEIDIKLVMVYIGVAFLAFFKSPASAEAPSFI